MKASGVKITIPKEEPCICGSGKIFSDCCMKKNHTYERFEIEGIDRKIIYDQTEVMDAVKSLLNFVEGRITEENRHLTKEEALRKLKKLYQKLDLALKPIGRVTSCKAGCGHCCSLLVPTTKLEGDIIEEYIKNHYSEEELQDFKEKINKNKDLLNSLVHVNDRFLENNYKAYAEAKLPCAFLDKDQRCTIYEARPFICRRYLVFNDPKVCENTLNNTNQYYSKYLGTVKDAIVKLNKLVYDKECEYKHTLSWFSGNNK